MNGKAILNFILNPYRVFAVLMLGVLIWLFLPSLPYQENREQIAHGMIVSSSSPYGAAALGPCSNVQCDPGYCCHPDKVPLCSPAGCGSDPTPVPVYPPSITASLGCSSPGSSGWCRGAASLDLSASDPQGAALLIGGSVDGNAFACPPTGTSGGAGDTSCSIPITNEGIGAVSYRVDSATGLSDSGSLSYKIDLTPPSINGSLSGTKGDNDWFVSDATVGASGDDALSGLASIEYSVNGRGWSSFPGGVTLSDGNYTVDLRATDLAGNSASTSVSFKVDTINPSLNVSANGTLGWNNWYTSDVAIVANANDSGSGVASLDAIVDAASTGSSSSTLSNGHHSYKFIARDNAGNVTESNEVSVDIDTAGPNITLTSKTNLGDPIHYSISEATSGLAKLIFEIEDSGGKYDPIVWTESLGGIGKEGKIVWDGKFHGHSASVGSYTLTITATDQAGNTSSSSGVIKVQFFSFLKSVPAFQPSSPPYPLPLAEGRSGEGTTGEQSLNDAPAAIPVPTPGVSSFGGGKNGIVAGGTTESFASTLTNNLIRATSGTNSNVLWGAAALAAVAGFAAEAERRRRAAAQAAAQEQYVGKGKRYGAIAAAYQAAMDKWNKVTQSSKVRIAKEDLAAQSPAEVKRELEAAANQRRAEAADAARWKGMAEQALAKQAASTGVQAQAVPKPTSILAKIPFVGSQLDSYITSTLRVPKPTNLPAVLKQFAGGATITAILLTAMWNSARTAAADAHFFDAAKANAQEQYSQLQAAHPELSADIRTKTKFLLSHPEEAFSDGYDQAKALTNALAGFGDAFWQANPVVQGYAHLEQSIGDRCAKMLDKTWGRRCSAVFYFSADTAKHPVDSIVHVAGTIITDPLAGLIKFAAFEEEHGNPITTGRELIQAVQEKGLVSGVESVVQDHFQQLGQFLQTDQQVQSAFIAAIFLLAAASGFGIPALLLGGGYLLIQTKAMLEGLDAAIQSARTRADAMKLVTDPSIRRQLVTTIILLALLVYGGGKEIKELKRITAYNDTLPASTQEAISKLPPWEQNSLLSEASKVGLPSRGIDLYLSETQRSGSLLTKLSISERVALVNGYLKSASNVELANVSLEQGFVLSEMAREFDLPISITGRWADTPAEISLRVASVARVAELRAQGVAEASAILQAAEEFGIDPQQVKISSAKPEVDVFVPKNLWDNLSQPQKDMIEQQFDIFNITHDSRFEVDFYQDIPEEEFVPGWPDPRYNAPAGSIAFLPDGTITHQLLGK